MHRFHIAQYPIQNRNVHISVLNGALWDTEQMCCAIFEIGLLTTPRLELFYGGQLHCPGMLLVSIFTSNKTWWPRYQVNPTIAIMENYATLWLNVSVWYFRCVYAIIWGICLDVLGDIQLPLNRSGVTLDLRTYVHLGRACRFTYAVRWSGMPRKSRYGLTYFHFQVLIWQGNIRSSRWLE